MIDIPRAYSHPIMGELLRPNEARIGDYSLLTSEGGDIQIIGQYEFLNLSGARISGGRLYAGRASKTGNILLAGAYIPQETDLRELEIDGVLYGQGLRTGRLLAAEVRDIDLSCGKIAQVLLYGKISNLNLRNGVFETFNFGGTRNNRLMTLDMRGTTISQVVGGFPADVRQVYLDPETTIPEDFREYLRSLR